LLPFFMARPFRAAAGPVHNRDMHDAAPVTARSRPPAWRRWLFALGLALGGVALAAEPPPAAKSQPTIILDKALSAAGAGAAFPAGTPTSPVTLPDD